VLPDILTAETVIASALVAGVFFSVAVSVIPALVAMPAGRYIETQWALGKGYHPIMPIIVNLSTAIEIVLAVIADTAAQRALFISGTVLFLGVTGVSHLLNVPINRRVRNMDPGNLPADWDDPRPMWRRWHYLRFAIAMCLLLVNIAGAMAIQ
jgi:uncharacterized membrane protein